MLYKPVSRITPFSLLKSVGPTLICACPILAAADTSTVQRNLAPGVVYSQQISTSDQPLIINCVSIDLRSPGVHIKCGEAKDCIAISGPFKGREPLHEMVHRAGAIAAINADYFPFTSDPLGLAVRDGELLSEPSENRACFGIDTNGARIDVLAHFGTVQCSDNNEVPIDGINRVSHTNEVVLRTPACAELPKTDQSGILITLTEVELPFRISKRYSGVVQTVVPLTKGADIPPCQPGQIEIICTGTAADRLKDHVHTGDKIGYQIDLVSNSPGITERGKYPSRSMLSRGAYRAAWTDVQQAVGGGPWLVRDSAVYIDWESEALNKTTFVEKRHPRSAVGIARNGEILLVTVDGRFPGSQGATLAELASIMLKLGAVNAMNLDGGGSTTMMVDGVVVNAPSDGKERPIADALLVFSDTYKASDTAADQALAIVPGVSAPLLPPNQNGATPSSSLPAIQFRAGDQIPLTIQVQPDLQANDTTTLWGTLDGMGFVSQKGVLTCIHAGQGTVVAQISGHITQLGYVVEAGPPAIVRAILTPIADFPAYYSRLTVTVTDRFGNVLKSVPVTVDAPGGKPDDALVTGANGTATTNVVWDALPGKRVATITVTGCKSISIRPRAAAGGSISQDPDDRP